MIEDNDFTIVELKKRWDMFKRKRSSNPYFSLDDPEFITILEREEIIDMLFDYALNQEQNAHENYI